MLIRRDLIRRLWPILTGESQGHVRRSLTDQRNRALRAALASHYADRGLLLLTILWLGIRVRTWLQIELRPESVYEPQMWLGWLVFPELPEPAVWYSLVGLALVMVVICLIRPRWIVPRVVLAAALLVVIAPEFGFGHMQHTNHLFLMAHVYSVFRPAGIPADDGEARSRAQGYTWFLLGLLAVYTASGLWKVVDMTIRDVIKPGVTWLDKEGMVATTIASMRTFDLPMTVPQVVDSISWIFPIGYVILTLIFSASFLAAFRRPLMLLVIPMIVIFHLLNAITLYAIFLSTIVVAVVVLLPYDYFVSPIKRQLTPVTDSSWHGTRADARYTRSYSNGDNDEFVGFYAYRERLRDRSLLLCVLLYYPGIAAVSTYLLKRSAARTGVRS